MSRTYHWDFPLPRTHTGILQGNGLPGTMIWGEANTLRITLGRADFCESAECEIHGKKDVWLRRGKRRR
ncbi:MAG: hypothetical protein AUJ92_05370 [Armatimonadetes bacterium CG2_30_59_28]|nr:MAG: hypothetical protein AUJ92_05370 [Armatimonadetes bacterium CG2_30_59_28]PIU63903.1 MAG: hypothetical protein COS85_14625 [Armatimonadetes bacterium CG07_land_8_20_14_0_80_59_28]PIY45950.1 MAG: hypothetical protein COZ05_06110 [Armatimonadetes bacterium CG_4_10_14_3_um_filter_59_10]PJB65808.1 MAG: hypothetical protein CO095_13750 [Armatimonadetes bacterium CG_4_9_14_3_um_filter_58_7]